MGRFARPAGAIAHYGEIQKWDVLWHAYGIIRPFVSGPEIVIRAPYREDDSIIFDTRQPRFNFINKNFASDGNLLPDHSYNDNYWFFTEQGAAAAKTYLEEQWAANPKLFEQELERRREERELDRMFSY